MPILGIVAKMDPRILDRLEALHHDTTDSLAPLVPALGSSTVCEVDEDTIPRPTLRRVEGPSGLTQHYGGKVVEAYTALHGHPLEHDGKMASTKRSMRWAYSIKTASVAVAALTLIAALALVASLWSPEFKTQEIATKSTQAVDPTPTADLTDQVFVEEVVGQGPQKTLDGSNESGVVWVHVAGAVKRPGLYDLQVGSRINDSINRAGGFKAKANKDSLNLAQPIVDGQQVYVPFIGEDLTSVGSSASGTTRVSGSKINVNTASLEQLDALPGIGPAIAQRILDFRESHGAFARVDDLQSVSGIGPSIIAKLADHATVGP